MKLEREAHTAGIGEPCERCRVLRRILKEMEAADRALRPKRVKAKRGRRRKTACTICGQPYYEAHSSDPAEAEWWDRFAALGLGSAETHPELVIEAQRRLEPRRDRARAHYGLIYDEWLAELRGAHFRAVLQARARAENR